MEIRQKLSRNTYMNLAYVIGISLVIAAIIYFFAANWGYFSRSAKTVLILLLIVFFYCFSYLFVRGLKKRLFISHLLLLAGVISFGVGVALLGQMYNSHADSYTLFAIWFIPALLLSFITKKESFAFLSYILAHITVWMFIDSYFFADGVKVSILVLLALANFLIFYFLRLKVRHYQVTAYSTLLVGHFIWFLLTMWKMYPSYSIYLHVAYLVITVSLLYLFKKLKWHSSFSIITISAYALYLFETVFRWMLEYSSATLYLFVLLLMVILVILSSLLINWIAKRNALKDKMSSFASVTAGVISVFSGFIIFIAYVGFIELAGFSAPFFTYYLVGAALLISGYLRYKQGTDLISHTLIYIGSLLTLFYSWDVSFIFILIILIISGFIWWKVRSLFVRSFLYFALQLFVIIQLLNEYMIFELEGIVFIIFILNVVLYSLSFFISASRRKDDLIRNSLFYALLSGFVLTFLYSDVSGLYIGINITYFIIITTLSFYFIKKGRKDEATLCLIFWFAYLMYKYYDMVWKLLHKSIALAIIGVIFLIIALYFDRQGKEIAIEYPFIWKRKWIIFTLVLLQIGFLSYGYISKEAQLNNGREIMLELQPIDPRSMMQGDYVRLSYEFNMLDHLIEDGVRTGDTIAIVLSKGEDGFYQYNGVYKHRDKFNIPYEENDNDILLNGKVYGYNLVRYGIETYFVGEGTGLQLEREATKAYVKVSETGDAIVEKIE